jgi:nitroreductase
MLEVIRMRRSIRKYIPKDVEEEKLQEVLKAAMFAPTSWGTRAWEFIIVKDGETRRSLSEATPYSSFVMDAPLVIVICYDISVGKRFKEDSSICAEHIHLEAVHQGLGSCFVQITEGSPGNHGDPETYVKGLLNLPGNYRVQCLMPIGYPTRELPEHSDSEFDESKIHYETFGIA